MIVLDQLAGRIHLGVILVAVVILAILAQPTRVGVLLCAAMRVAIKLFGPLTPLDALVVLTAVALPGHLHDARVDDLAGPPDQPIVPQESAIQLEELTHAPRAKALLEDP